MKALPLTIVLGALACAATAQAPKSTPSVKKQDQCTLVGTVLKLAGSEPLPKARVILQSMADRTQSIGVRSDAGGHFALQGVNPGSYKLRVFRAGFVTFEYGQRKAGDPGATLTLRPGQEMKDLVFRLIPSAVIAGRILDEDGEPLSSVNVSAAREVYSEGKRSLATITTSETNDLGEYRLFGLPPGRYFVSAVYSHWARFGAVEQADDVDASASPQGYARLYYPGTPDAGKADSIVVKAGEEIPSVEILMRQARVYRVRGHAYNQITHKPGTEVNLILASRSASREWDFGNQESMVQKADGSFELPEVLPGSYSLLAFWFDEGKIYSARTSVDVGNADVEGVSIVISPGTSVNGRVIWDGKPSLERDELTVVLLAKDAGPDFSNPMRVDASNSFTLKNVSDGAYTAEVNGESKDCYVKDEEYSGTSVLDEGFTVTAAAPGFLEITLSSHGARLQGAATNKDGLPAAGAWVVLVPDKTKRAHRRLFKTQTTDQYGHFDLRGIAPGDYRLFSWEEVEDGAWEDPEFLKPFEEKGERVSVQEGDSKSVNLQTMETASAEQPKP